MSVAEHLARWKEIAELIRTCPPCWGIYANSVHARAESMTIVALFDTQEQAQAYIDASRIPGSRVAIQQRFRSFLPDSLLWDYNGIGPGDCDVISLTQNNPFARGLSPINPPPPSGDLTRLRELIAERDAETAQKAIQRHG